MQFVAKVVFIDGCCRNGVTIFVFRYDIRHTASAIDIINDNTGSLRNLKQQSVGACHVTLVTAAVHISYFSTLQIPSRTNLHLCGIVSSKEAANLVGITARIGISRIEVHLIDHAIVLCYLINAINKYLINHFAGIVNINNGFLGYCGIVAATESIDDGTAHYFQIGFCKFGFSQTIIWIGCRPINELLGGIVISAITTSEELTDVNLLIVVSRHIAIHLGRDAHKSIPTLIHQIFCGFFDFSWNRLFQSAVVPDDSRNVVAAIYVVDKHVVRRVLAINMNERMTTDISLLGATEYTVQVASINGNIGIAFCVTGITASVNITTNSNLCLHQCCRHTK